jgi:hypothetical protein
MPEVRLVLLFWIAGLVLVLGLRVLRGGWSRQSIRTDLVGGVLIGSLVFALLKVAA